MSDLISRSEVIKALEECNLDKQLFEKDVFEKIYEIQTAYDIDKVVEELEKATQYIKIDGKPTSVKAIHPAQAIEIIKQGGVDEHKTLKCEGCRFEHIKEDDAFNCDCVHCSRAYSDCYEKVVE